MVFQNFTDLLIDMSESVDIQTDDADINVTISTLSAENDGQH